MAGILDSKKRVMDTIIGLEARRQAASGRMRFNFVTFTDRHAFYDNASPPTGSDVADDATKRIYFEASQRYQDQITIETDNQGLISMMSPFLVEEEVTAFSGAVEKMKLDEKGALVLDTDFASSVQVLSHSQQLVAGIGKNFSHQMMIASHDYFSHTKGFKLSTGSIDFIVNTSPGAVTDYKSTIPVEGLTSLWNDWRFSHIPNFKYMAPINKLIPGAKIETVVPFTNSGLNLKKIKFHVVKAALSMLDFGAMDEYAVENYLLPTAFGIKDDATKSAVMQTVKSIRTSDLTEIDYTTAKMSFMFPFVRTINEPAPLTVQDLELNLKKAKFPSQTIEFTETSNLNNIISQIFEVSEDGFKKLTIIDHGMFPDTNPNLPGKRVFFVGKMYQDPLTNDFPSGEMKFANIFTIIFQ